VTDPESPWPNTEEPTMTTANPLHPTTAAPRRPAIVAFLAAMLAAATLAVPVAHASDEHLETRRERDGRDFDTWADGRLVDVQLLVDGQPAPLYFAPGRGDRHYLQAFAGRNYSIVLRNNTGRRVAVLLAVDGLNAVDGEKTKLRSTEPMYVLGPWEQATIRGWRTSLREIRRFVFVDEQRSYATRTGQANSDMGWIRVLAFREQRPWWETRERPWGRVKRFHHGDDPSAPHALPAPEESTPQAGNRDSREEAAPQESAAPQAKRQALGSEAQDNLARGENESRSFPGTGWGDRREDRVRRVEFTPEAVAADHLVFRYEYASGLRALGIQPPRGQWRDRLGERDGDLGFAKPPRW
jgi:hypothetical protein